MQALGPGDSPSNLSNVVHVAACRGIFQDSCVGLSCLNFKFGNAALKQVPFLGKIN